MTLTEIKQKILDLLGEDIANPDTQYTSRFNTYIDIAQKEIAKVVFLYKKLTYTQRGNNINVQSSTDDEFTGTQKTVNLDGLCFCVDIDTTDATVLLQQYTGGNWNTIATITEFPYKNAVNGTMRLVFDGTSYYKYKIKTFTKPYKTTEIPTVEDYSYYDLPTDYYKMVSVNINEYTIYTVDKKIGISSEYDGELIIEYKAIPTTINIDTANSYELEIDENAQECIPYYVAAQCKRFDDEFNSYTLLISEYQNKLANIDTQKPYSIALVGDDIV